MTGAAGGDRPDIYRSGAYLDANPDWHAADAPFKAAWIAELLARNALDPASMVEVGCGSGAILADLKRRYPRADCEGFEIAPAAYAIAATKAAPGLAFHLGDPFAAGRRYELAMAIDVIEHVEDYMAFVRSMRPLGHRQLFHIPLDLSVQGLLRGRPLMHSRAVVGHLHYFCKETALATLRDCGLEVLDWRYTHGAETLPGRSLRTRLFNGPRRAARRLAEDLAVRVMGGASMLVLTR